MNLRDKKGFTLIELMIVVAIIGILAAIAIPNFLKFQCKGRQSEARTNLGGIFTAEKSFFSTYNEYSSSLPAINWAPTGCPRYVYGFAQDNFEPSNGTNLEAAAYIAAIQNTANGNLSCSQAGPGTNGAMVDANNVDLYSSCWNQTVCTDLGNAVAPNVGFTWGGNQTPQVSAAGDHFLAGAVATGATIDGDTATSDAQVMNDYREAGFGTDPAWTNDCAD